MEAQIFSNKLNYNHFVWNQKKKKKIPSFDYSSQQLEHTVSVTFLVGYFGLCFKGPRVQKANYGSDPDVSHKGIHLNMEFYIFYGNLNNPNKETRKKY